MLTLKVTLLISLARIFALLDELSGLVVALCVFFFFFLFLSAAEQR